MGVFDRDSGVSPSGQDLYWHDQLSRGSYDGGGGGGGGWRSGCLDKLMTIGFVILVILVIFGGLYLIFSLLWAGYKPL